MVALNKFQGEIPSEKTQTNDKDYKDTTPSKEQIEEIKAHIMISLDYMCSDACGYTKAKLTRENIAHTSDCIHNTIQTLGNFYVGYARRLIAPGSPEANTITAMFRGVQADFKGLDADSVARLAGEYDALLSDPERTVSHDEKYLSETAWAHAWTMMEGEMKAHRNVREIMGQLKELKNKQTKDDEMDTTKDKDMAAIANDFIPEEHVTKGIMVLAINHMTGGLTEKCIFDAVATLSLLEAGGITPGGADNAPPAKAMQIAYTEFYSFDISVQATLTHRYNTIKTDYEKNEDPQDWENARLFVESTIAALAIIELGNQQ
ncbi:MAG: hypothetical protein FWD33_03185 [Alphaproteobacteria bacterium]|nr:hypothetical protein [Alphaproteobacteria bacterium]